MGGLRCLIPQILLPTFTWPHRVVGSVPLASSIPPSPPLAHRLVRRLCGVLHNYLRTFSRHYCSWVGIQYNNQIAQLPFGLVLKWSDGTRLEEVIAMISIRSAGFPVPKVISYGEHPHTPHAPASILMTRVPGGDLVEVYEQLSEAERAKVSSDLNSLLLAMRSWKSPWGDKRICSITGSTIRSVRVPNHSVGSCESEAEFNDYLLSTASSHAFPSQDSFKENLMCAKKMQDIHHSVVFTHGDLKPHNVMVHQGRISGFIDWESAGWYPDYWDFTTAIRFLPEDYWWYRLVADLGASKYMTEREFEKALTSLTIDSYVW